MTRRDLRALLDRPLAAAAVAAIVAGLIVGAAEAIYDHAQAKSARNDVSRVLDRASTLLAAKQRRAAVVADEVSALGSIQAAYASRDEARLARFAKTHPAVGFVLWDGRTIGVSHKAPIQVGVKVIGGHGQLGSVIASVAPNDALLAGARSASGRVRLVYAVGDQVEASSPSKSTGSQLALPSHRTVGQLSLRASPPAAFLFAYTKASRVPLAFLWILLAALLAALAGFRFPLLRRTGRRANVRDALAIVGETLAATHNPNALLPVILEAATEATGAVGGTISTRGVTRAKRGSSGGAERLEVPIRIEEGVTSTLELYAAEGVFDGESRDAAQWIARQGEIALENARLHSLVKQQAVTDELTGLANRRRFVAQLEAEVARAERSGTPLSVVLADLDDFKRVNDTWGHDVGDTVLRRVATVMQAATRDVDLTVRLGGEEFAILLPETDTAGARRLAERVREAIEASTIETSKAAIRITASFGIACFPETAESAQLLLEADRRLYDAKRAGKNRVVTSVAAE
ncbi:MAG TPA: GGDEF domain-containing protein [Gaiellaceae bacterium]|nr:GGDEF domain-containing protein [Gaiellaceae bacterium]